MSNPEWKLLVAEKNDVLKNVRCVNQKKLVLNYMHDCKVRLNYILNRFEFNNTNYIRIMIG